MTEFEQQYGFNESEWRACVKVLTRLKEDPLANPDNDLFAGLVGKVVKQAKKHRRKASYGAKKKADQVIVDQSTIASNALQGVTAYSSGNPDDDLEFTPIQLPRNCYCCNRSYNLVHEFYARLCPSCAEVNYRNRFRSIGLSGRHVIITGGRVKIGYATALKFLRSGANVTITSRFPATALQQFETEADYPTWSSRFSVYGLDLRSLPQVHEFVGYFRSKHDSLDILINNAAQTIKYDDSYYRPLIDQEQKLLHAGSGKSNLIANPDSAALDSAAMDGPAMESAAMDREVLNLQAGANNSMLTWATNRFGQPVDERTKTSWNSVLGDVDLVELLEVNLINQISPYVLIKELTPLFGQSTFEKRFIINVTSAEGQFSYDNKSIFHPHTNMTKASLNMLTRTSAREYLGSGVYMNAVDVGWVSTGATERLRQRQFAQSYIPPLDPVDGAARVMVPIIDELAEDAGTIGKLFKNYQIQDW